MHGLTRLLVLPLLLAAGPAAAQPAVEEVHDQPWQVVSLTEDARFSSVYVFAVDFTRDGVAWLATSNGLYRYDGYTWQRFTTDHGLPTNFVRSVLVTRGGELWVGTSRGAGVFGGGQFDARGSEAGLAGPSVRRIVEDPDGTLWFCSDRWPDPDVVGGLAALRAGAWRRFGSRDGIVQDYVHNYFRDSRGRQFALTVDSILLRTGDRWAPFQEPGFPADARASWQMVELPNGELVLQQEGRLLAQRGASWVSTPRARAPMVVTRGGELVSATEQVARRTIVFERWRPDGFAAASAEAVIHDSPSEMLREAPDGSIWCVGKGMLVRWRFRAPTWQALRGLPPPQAADRQGRAWFADGTAVWSAHEGRLEAHPGATGPLHASGGDVWAASATGFVRFVDGLPQIVPREPGGLAAIDAIATDTRGHASISGRSETGTPVLRVFDGAAWRSPAPSIPAGFEVIMIEPDPASGVWLTLGAVDGPQWLLARVERDAVQVLPSAGLPSLQRARVAVTPEMVCLYDYTGVYQAADRTLRSWRQIEVPLDAADRHFHLGGGPWLSFSGLRAGRRGVAARQRDAWVPVPIDWRGNVQPGGRESLLVPTTRGFYIVRADAAGPAPAFVAAPDGMPVTLVVEDGRGIFWVATSQDVVRYAPDLTPLQVAVSAPVIEMRHDRLFRAALSARRRYELPRAAERVQFSWQVDEGPWTPFRPVEALELAAGSLPAGSHYVQVRARDAHGVMSAGSAGLQVVLLPVPLQERAWFWPALGLVAAMLVYTTAAARTARARLGRQARGLERKVRARTEELEFDIARRERAEAALRASEQRFRSLFNSAFQSICVLAPDGIVHEANQTALDVVGLKRDDVVGRPFWTTAWWRDSPAQQQQLRAEVERAARGELVRFEATQSGRDGAAIAVECSLKPVVDDGGRVRFLISESRDISERRQAERDRARLETQLRQAQKMEAIGTLAGGIAHDFNNLLTPIFGNAELAAMQLPEDHPLQDRLAELLLAAQRARDLVTQILIFSRRQEQERRLLPLGPVVLDALRLMRASLPSTIEITARIPDEGPSVLAEATQIHQVVMNLCTNAAHAMPEGGRLEVELARVDVDAELAGQHPRLRVGPYARLRVSDSGVGIEPATLERIFEPFFSTRPPGQGTGLGLSVVHGILANHDGAIAVQTEPGHGAAFTLYFPAVDVPAHAAEPVVRQPPRGAGERILIVDDEEAVADVAVHMLEHAGYVAERFTDPAAAIAEFARDPDRFALVLTDLTMPKLTGIELAREVRAIRPGARIVLGSGFSDHLSDDLAREAGIAELVAKPYTVDGLARAVNRVLRPVPTADATPSPDGAPAPGAPDAAGQADSDAAGQADSDAAGQPDGVAAGRE